MEWYYIRGTERVGPVTEENIARLLGTGTIDQSTQVWNPTLPAWQPLASSNLASLLNSTSEPPPVPGAAVGNNLIWLLTFCPLIGGIATILLSPLVNGSGGLFWLMPALNLLCVYADERRLRRAGYDTKLMGATWFIPRYLWRRATLLGQSKVYFWFWCVTFVLAMLVL